MSTKNNVKMDQKSPKSRFSKSARFDRTSFLCRIIFSYVYPTFLTGLRKNGLDLDDIDRCPIADESENVTKALLRNWEQAKRQPKSRPSFAWVTIRTFGPYYILPLCIYLFEECVLRIAQPYMLSRVIRYFSGDETIEYKWACIYAGGVCLCTFAFVSMHHPMMQHIMRLGMRIRTACCALMYQKSLKLSRASIGQTAVGQIINIMSNDVNRLDEFSIFASYLIVAPIQAAIIIYYVWYYIGTSCLVGIVLILLLPVYQGIMGKYFSRIRLNTAILTDTRLRYMNEIISGMRVIKMYNWQIPFAKRVAEARKSEITQVRRSLYLKATNLSMFFVMSRIILFACFVVFVLFGGTLTAEMAFVLMALFNTLRLLLTYMFPQAIFLASELKVTLKRIENFLLLEEMNIKENREQSESIKNHASPPQVVVNRISAKWTSELKKPTLMNISANLKPGDLLAVIGSVGSGKSSFLMSLLKELPIDSGSININGKVSYASQDAWSFNETVRNNILFGMEYNEQKYKEIIDVCALKRDLKIMPFGDRTLVGEKGVSLSGGQKARINLARAVYRDADICLLDDPLSAVDTSVAEHIFDRCIVDYLKDKICILVTHQIQFIEKATQILILNEGQCLAYGTFEEIQQMGIDFMSILDEQKQPEMNNEPQQDGNKIHPELSRSISQDALKGRSRTLSSVCTENFEVPDADEGDDDSPKMVEEKMEHGSIDRKIYWEYLKSGPGLFWWIITLFFTIVSQVLFHGSDIFLTYWTDTNQKENLTKVDPNNEQHRDIYLYAIIIAALFITTLIRAFSFFHICMEVSINLHNSIFKRLLRAPVAFFDSNPVGRILNRFTKDLGVIDENLSYTGFDLNLTLAQGIGVCITVGIVNLYLLIPALVLAIVIVVVRGIYIKSARDIKRYEGLARSPVYSHISTTINGLASIRAYGAQRTFEKQFYTYQNDHSATWFIFLSTSRAVGLLLDWITSIYICAIAVAVMLVQNLPGGDVGLAFTSGLLLAGMTQWGVRQSTEFESQMTSVERIIEYKSLEQEAPAKSEEHLKPKDEWPQNGEIVFDHMNLSYGGIDAKPVLRDINCTIMSGEKIGIVGRTGAGKSSIIAALFRLTEPTGTIRIDGINIQSIGIDDLRQKLSIIPQDPVVFSGTVRYNLDPFNEYSDYDIWSALEEVQLKSQVENYNGKLDAPISEGGGNLSVGQRQLICLARAILRRNKILVLDEATANVDHRTDNLIQKTIRTKFFNCTVLTIAHRLNTIIDCDRVLVLDAGEIVEFDTPFKLLKNRNVFYDMCKKTGHLMYAQLYRTAKNVHQNKNRQQPMDNSNEIDDEGIGPEDTHF